MAFAYSVGVLKGLAMGYGVWVHMVFQGGQSIAYDTSSMAAQLRKHTPVLKSLHI